VNSLVETVAVEERPGEGQWIAKPFRARYVQQGIGFGLLYIIYLVVNRFARAYLEIDISIFGVLTISAIAIGWKLWRTFEARRVKRPHPEDVILADGNFGDQYPAEIAVFARQRSLGMDRGVVWFSDGLMGFSGSSFSFVLSAKDIAPQWVGVKRDSRYPTNSIVLKDAPVPGHLVVTPLGANNNLYRERLYRFSQAAESPTGERIWPPLTPFDPESALGSLTE